ncbi:Las1-like-domain-containing protein [Globomyces pollinis-pini]|nr:Las1-like-domain-containing protein [Globomyces pollinis-pini]
MQPRLVPWFSFEEWEKTFEQLYSFDVNEQQLGINRVQSWAMRGKLPQAIAVTAQLVSAGQRVSNGIHNSQEESHILAMALIRFVNGIVDAAQKGAVAASVVSVAESLGLPTWIIELRHDVTHGKFPSLPYLMKGRNEALEWLRYNYWIIQATAAKELDVKIYSLLETYQIIMKQLMDSGESPVESHDLQETLTNITVSLTMSDYPDVLIPKLLLDGNLVSSTKKNRVAFGKLLDDYNLNLWEPLITCCESTWPGFGKVLFESIIEYNHRCDAGKSGQSFQSTLNAWAKYLLSRFLIKATDFEVDETVLLCLEVQNKYTLDLALHIKSQATLSKSVQALLLFAAKSISISNRKLDHTIESSDIEITVEELQDELSKLRDRISIIHPKHTEPIDDDMDIDVNKSTGWARVTDWVSCPIGSLPGSFTVQDLTLDPSFDNLDWLHEQGWLYVPIIGLNTSQKSQDTNEMEIHTIQEPDLKSIAKRVQFL